MSNTGPVVASAFRSIFNDTKYYKRKRHPIRVRTYKGIEFLNRGFQDMLRRECIQFQVCKNPDVKCSDVERAHRTIRYRLYNYFTYKNNYRFIDVLPKFVTAYNDYVHFSIRMAPT